MNKILLFSIALVLTFAARADTFEYTWQIDETPEGQETVNATKPVEVVILDDQVVNVPIHSASIALMHHYSVHLDANWIPAYASRLLQTFETIPQTKNHLRDEESNVPASLWQLADHYIQDDIQIEYQNDVRVVTISKLAFVYAQPLLSEIDGVRGRYFSRRLHNAVLRFVTDNGTDHRAVRHILRDRYAVSIDVPNYTALAAHTTGEDAERFSEFKSEELMALISMLEEFPQGMIKTPGLKYLVRRLDGTPHPLYPSAPAVAWTSAGYIEFMETAFSGGILASTHRLILHEKAHFLWTHLFDDQLKQDWISLGGWYENPDAPDGWSTTQQTEFVSAYAHGVNPNEDMAESISFYIVNPDKLRSRAPAKYEFIQNRIMHGTRYISQIREDLTFTVYNLYPDYVYPGRIVRVDIRVNGTPEEDKQITVEIELHSENELDTAKVVDEIRLYSEKGTDFSMRLYPITIDGTIIESSHILRGHTTLSKYAAHGLWVPNTISLQDAQGNARHESQTDFGWMLYIDNPLADCEAPRYVSNTMRLSLSQANTHEGEYQLVTAQWQLIEKNGVSSLGASINDTFADTYSKFAQGYYDPNTSIASVSFKFPDYMPSGVYSLNHITMRDTALNSSSYYFTDSDSDEMPQTIKIHTTNPDLEPPELDLNRITIHADPTNPEEPNGETIVDIKFYARDNISGYTLGSMLLRDPHGVTHHYYHYPVDRGKLYFQGDPTIFKEYQRKIVLPVGSIPGTWGLAEMTLKDKAGNRLNADFTEIVRFVVGDKPTGDINSDGEVNILDLVIIANAIGTDNKEADVNDDGEVNILDLVAVANQIN